MTIKRTFAAALLALFTGAEPVESQTPAPAARAMADSVRKIDSLWAHAYFTHDTTYALKAMAPEIAITATAGNMKTRTDELADVRETPGWKVNYFRSTGVVVRPYGNAAVVTGTLEWELVQGSSAPAVTKRRYTATYVRGGSLGFQMVALHIGRAP